MPATPQSPAPGNPSGTAPWGPPAVSREAGDSAPSEGNIPPFPHPHPPSTHMNTPRELRDAGGHLLPPTPDLSPRHPHTWRPQAPHHPSLPGLPPGRPSGRCHPPALWPPTLVSPNLSQAPSCVTPSARPRSPGGPRALPGLPVRADPPEPPRPASPGAARPRPAPPRRAPPRYPPSAPGLPNQSHNRPPWKEVSIMRLPSEHPAATDGRRQQQPLVCPSAQVSPHPRSVPHKLVSRPLIKTVSGHPHPRGLTRWAIKI